MLILYGCFDDILQCCRWVASLAHVAVLFNQEAHEKMPVSSTRRFLLPLSITSLISLHQYGQ